MRLDPDCVRDILLCVEENAGLNRMCCFRAHDDKTQEMLEFLGDSRPKILPYQVELEKTYSNEQVMYHLLYCYRANLILCADPFTQHEIVVHDLSPAGHNFLADIRENRNWAKVKHIAGKVGSTSISSLVSIASAVISELVKLQFGTSSQ